MASVLVNGRFQVHRVTGMQRYARELVSRLGPTAEVIRPGKDLRGARGHLWEQTVLARRARGEILWSPCSTGPLAHPRQVVTIHDCAFIDQAETFSPSFARWYQWLVPRLARRARHVITISEFSRQRIIERLGVDPGRISVIANGVSAAFTEPADPLSPTLQRLRHNGPYLLGLGSLEPRKNLPRLLRAWASINASFPEYRLLIAGGGGDIFAGLPNQQLPPRTQLLGFVPEADLPALYAAADAFVYASVYEGFGLPVLEAMACGTPVICSQDTAIGETAGNAAQLVDPQSASDIAEGIKKVLSSHELRAKLSSAGLQRSREFSWQKAAEETALVLENVSS